MLLVTWGDRYSVVAMPLQQNAAAGTVAHHRPMPSAVADQLRLK